MHYYDADWMARNSYITMSWMVLQIPQEVYPKLFDRFSMDVATGRCRISECILSSTAANSAIYFSSSCQKGSNTGFFGRPLSFLKSQYKSVSFDSRIKLTRCLSTSSSFWLEPVLLSSVLK